MKIIIKALLSNKTTTILTSLIVIFTSLASSLIFFEYVRNYDKLTKQFDTYNDFDIILINPDGHIKQQIDLSKNVIIYKRTYEKIDDAYIEIISSCKEGIEIGLPSYIGELILTKINDTEELSKDVVYSTHPLINNLDKNKIQYPEEVFIRLPVNEITSFIIEDSINEGYIYFINGDINLIDYLKSKNVWGKMTIDTYIGPPEILIGNTMNNYKSLMIVYGVLATFPSLFSAILFSILIRYLIDKRNDEIVIKHIFYTKKTKTIFQFLFEFLIICLPGSVIAIILSHRVMGIDFNYALLMIFINLGVFILSYFYLLNKNFRKISKTKNIGLLMRKDKSWLD